MTTRPLSGAGWRLAWIPHLETFRGNWDSSAVYFIVCQPTKVGYIGSAKKLVDRLKNHFSNLALGTHGNYKMQSAFNRYGIDKFDCGIVELCTLERLAEREQYWINRYPPERLFNIQMEVKRSYPVVTLTPADALRLAVDNGIVLPEKPEKGWIQWFMVRHDAESLPYEYIYLMEDENYLCGKHWITSI